MQSIPIIHLKNYYFFNSLILQFMDVGYLAGVTYPRYRVPQEGRNSCPLLRSRFIGSCHVWCLETFFSYYQPCSLFVSRINVRTKTSLKQLEIRAWF